MNAARWHRCRKVVITLVVAVTVHGCGTVTDLQAVDDVSSRPDLSPYERVIIGNFTDRATETRSFRTDAKGVEKKAAYEADVKAGGQKFAAYIVDELRELDSFAEVVRSTEPGVGDLYIDGDITRYARGNAAAKLFIGFGAGNTHFDAVVRLHDGVSSETLATVVVDKNAYAIGGIIATVQNVDGFMRAGAKKIARELSDARSATNGPD